MKDRARGVLKGFGRATYANVMATIAFFLAVTGGVVYAADKIGSRDIAKDAVKSKHIDAEQVKTKDLAEDAVTSPKVADGSLLSQDFGANQLPAGPKGDTGPTGPTGPPGPPGPTELYMNQHTETVAPSAVETADVNCNIDSETGLFEEATGGGGEWLGIGAWGPLLESAPLTGAISTTGWRVVVRNDDTAERDVVVRAICAG